MLFPAFCLGKWAVKMVVMLGWLAQGKMLILLECVIMMVLEYCDVILSTTWLSSQSEWRVVRSFSSVAQLLRNTRQTSGGDGNTAARLDMFGLL